MRRPGAPSDEVRLFLALWPGAATRARLDAAAARWTFAPAARRVPAERLHLTLHFLGALPRARLAEAIDALEVPFEPFTLAFGRDELWSNGIASLRPERPLPAPLLQLHARLSDARRDLGVEPEARAWRPHVTLARDAQGTPLPQPGARWRWPLRGYALVESVSRPVLTYCVLHRYRAVPAAQALAQPR